LSCRITSIDFTDTEFTLQQLPEAFANMTQLDTLLLQGTTLTSGPLPRSLGSLSQLKYLQLSGGPNNLGTLPLEWGQPQNLQQLHLFNMSLSGQLPSSYSNMTALQEMHLENITGLTTTLDDWWGFISRPGAPSQQEVSLVAMGLQGTLPAAIINVERCGCAPLCMRVLFLL
jgi:hypothetical protein